MIEPWVNPRSRFLWFRRRVPKQYRAFGMPAEIKFSLETTDRDEAVLRCQEENLKLERQWRSNLVGTPPHELTHLQIVALAGEFYADSRCCDGVFAWSEWMPASMLTGQALFIAHAYMPARPSAVLRSIKDRFVHHHIR
jgi:hypothetical protein